MLPPPPNAAHSSPLGGSVSPYKLDKNPHVRCDPCFLGCNMMSGPVNPGLFHFFHFYVMLKTFFSSLSNDGGIFAGLR